MYTLILFLYLFDGRIQGGNNDNLTIYKHIVFGKQECETLGSEIVNNHKSIIFGTKFTEYKNAKGFYKCTK